MSKHSRSDYKLVLREYIESLFIAIILAIVLRLFVFSAYKIPSESMMPTLRVGDFIFAYKLPYGVDLPLVGRRWSTGHLPSHGELIVFKHPKDKTVSYVKRVVGLPGDKVEIRSGLLLINDVEASQELIENISLEDLPNILEYQIFAEKFSPHPHAIMKVKEDQSLNFGPQIIPPGQVFVLGDNRSSSDDSRYWGPVPLEYIEGRVFMIWMSLDWVRKQGGLPSIRWNRLFKTF